MVLAAFEDEILPPSSFFFAGCLAKALLTDKPDESCQRFASNICDRAFLDDTKQPEVFLTHAVQIALQDALLAGGHAVVSHQPFMGTLTVNAHLDKRKHASGDISVVFRDCRVSVLVGEGKVEYSSFSENNTQIALEVHHLRLTEAAALGRDPSMVPMLLMGFGFDRVDFKMAIPTHRKDVLGRVRDAKPGGDPDDVVFRLVEVGTQTTKKLTFEDLYGRAIAVVVRWINLVERYFTPLTKGTNRIICKLPHHLALQMVPSLKGELGIVSESPDAPFYGGPYVSVLKNAAGEHWVFKEYITLKTGPPARVTPPPELLATLKSVRPAVYNRWEVLDSPDLHPGISILRYPFVKGEHSPPNLAAWIRLLEVVKALHDNNFVHCDILPQNMMFTENEGILIDFDLAREAGTGSYPRNFDYRNFVKERHRNARPRALATKDHDLHALVYLTNNHFDVDVRNVHSVQDLIQALQSENANRQPVNSVAVRSGEGTYE